MGLAVQTIERVVHLDPTHGQLAPFRRLLSERASAPSPWERLVGCRLPFALRHNLGQALLVVATSFVWALARLSEGMAIDQLGTLIGLMLTSATAAFTHLPHRPRGTPMRPPETSDVRERFSRSHPPCAARW
jgi:hypothetical protein